ncbi:Integrase zinc-binding domain - like 10 [Theobroma cacao]|nr:Integrase zinc-binding domain - like 10 [Theobroma cacao]
MLLEMKSLGIQLSNGDDGTLLASFVVRPSLLNQIMELQKFDDELKQKVQKLRDGETSEFRLGDDGILMVGDRVYVPKDDQLRRAILEEAHSSAYALHFRSTKMYRTIKESYWWPSMKRDIAEFVTKCLTCQQIKAKYQKPSGTLQLLPIPEWNDKIKVILEQLKTTQDRHKSYYDRQRKDLEIEVDDKVFLKVSLWKGVIQFVKRGKLNPRYIGPFRIIERIGPVAYKLGLPPELDQIHNVFHVSMLKKYVPDPSHILESPPIEL